MTAKVASGWVRTWLAKDFEGVSHDGSITLVHGNVFQLAQLIEHQNYGTFIFFLSSSFILFHSRSLLRYSVWDWPEAPQESAGNPMGPTFMDIETVQCSWAAASSDQHPSGLSLYHPVLPGPNCFDQAVLR